MKNGDALFVNSMMSDTVTRLPLRDLIILVNSLIAHVFKYTALFSHVCGMLL